MIYRLTEEEQKQVNELYQKFINTPKENEALKDKIDNEFIALMDSIEIKRFNENIKDTERLIKNAEDLINDAILYEYVFLALPWLIDPNVPIPKEWKGDAKPVYQIGESFIEEHKHVDVWVYYHDLIEKLSKEPPQEPLLLFDRENIKQYLESKIIAKHIAYLKGTEHERKLIDIINNCLDNSDFIFNENKAIQSNLTSAHKINYKKREITLDKNYKVAMANYLIENGINTLTANELKLLRLAICQSKMSDDNLYEYEIAAKELAAFFKIDLKNLYKNLDKMTDHIQQAFIKIKDEEKQTFYKQSWVDHCEYSNNIVSIKIADGLKPYILGLKKCFFALPIEEYIFYKCKHTIIIRELLEAKMKYEKPYGDNVVEIPISLEELKRVTNTSKGYEKMSHFRSRVLDIAIKEINEHSESVSTGYYVTVKPYKNGRSIAGFTFTIESLAHYHHYHVSNDPAKIILNKQSTRKGNRKKQSEEDNRQLTFEDVYIQE